MTAVWAALSFFLLIPFVGWGVYTLRLRYIFNEELEPRYEWITLGAVAAFCVVEMLLVRAFTTDSVVFYLFAVLGIIVATVALYGPMMISLASQAVVDFWRPVVDHDDTRPHFGPAEALEQMGDWDGALQEYTVMARIFPKHAEPAARMANMLMELSRHDEAARMFARAFDLAADPETAWRVANRLSGVYERQLTSREEAARVLADFLERFPDAKVAESVKKRIGRLQGSAVPAGEPVSDLLEPPQSGPLG